MTLYELTGDYVGLKRMLDTLDDGEDAQVILDTLDAVRGDMDEKADAICITIASVTAEMDALKQVKARTEARIKTREALVKRLRDYLMTAMMETGRQKIKTLRYSMSLGKSKAVALDSNDIPEEYLRVKTEPDKTAIKAALEAGEKLGFAHLEESTSLRIVG